MFNIFLLHICGGILISVPQASRFTIKAARLGQMSTSTMSVRRGSLGASQSLLISYHNRLLYVPMFHITSATWERSGYCTRVKQSLVRLIPSEFMERNNLPADLQPPIVQKWTSSWSPSVPSVTHDMHDTPYGTSSMRVSQMQMKGEGVFERRTTPRLSTARGWYTTLLRPTRGKTDVMNKVTSLLSVIMMCNGAGTALQLV